MTVDSSTLTKSISKLFADGFFSTTPRFCLVPEVLYEEENQDLWLNFGQEHVESSQQIISELISWQQCVCVHETTDADLIDKETGQTQRHAVSALLQWLNEQCLQDALICAKKEEQIVLILLWQGKLQLATIRNVETSEDILYHIVNIFTKWDLPSTTFMVYTIGIDEAETLLLNEYLTLQKIP